MSRLHIDPDYPVDSLWDFFYQHVGSMMNSHYHDIVTYSGAFLVCIIMFFVKKHIKNKWIIILMASFLSLGFYIICATHSNRLLLKTNWTLVAFVAPMAYLTIIGLLRGDWINRVTVYSGALFIMAYNYIYCIINEDHHKMCYSLKWFILMFGIAGYVRNIVNSINKRKKAKESEVFPKNTVIKKTVETMDTSDIQNMVNVQAIELTENTTETENSRDPE